MKIIKRIISPFSRTIGWFIHTSLIKKIIILAILGAALYGAYYYISAQRNKSAVTTDTVKKGTIVDTVSESGNLQANQLTVYSISNGVIDQLYVKNGDSVEKGDDLFKVKSTVSDQDKADAYSNYASAQNSLSSAQNDLKSQQSALEKVLDDIHLFQYGNGGFGNVGSANETQAQKTQREQAEANVRKATDSINSAKAKVTSSHLNYQATQDAVITAQVGGTISNLSYGVGDQVTAAMATSGSNTGTSASPVLVIGTATEFVVKIQINEVDINKIKVGQPASVTFDAIKDTTFKGEVTRVDNYGTDNSGVITYNVYVQVNEPNEQIKPLMSAVVDIETQKHENALLVPNSAVKPYKGGKAVQVKDTSRPGNQLKYIQVKTGIKDVTQTEILDGVTEGMEIVTSSTTKTDAQQSSGGGLGPGG